MNISKLTLTALLVAVVGLNAGVLAAGATHSTPAVQGYDVVTYHTGKRPIRGNGNFTADHDGATYLFSSAQNMQVFIDEPEKYIPAYNGYCAFGVSVGKKFIGDPEVWRLINGKTYLNLDVGIQEQWLKDTAGRIRKAEAKWVDIKDRAPSSL